MMQPKKRAKKMPGVGIPERGMPVRPPMGGKPGEPRYTIMPVSRTIGPRFVAEDVKPAPSGTSSRVRKERPVFSGVNKRAEAKAAAEAKLANLPKPGSQRGMGNKERAMQQGPGGRGAERYKQMMAKRKKSAKKRPPYIVDTFKG